MANRWIGILVVSLAALAPPEGFAAGESVQSTGPEFSDCSIGTGAAQLVAQCASLSVPLDPSVESGESLSLAIARIPARRRSSKTDALTLIAGGPGQSAIESFPAVAFAFRHIMQDRDVILVDQRGTGKSAKLDCPAAPDSIGLEFDVDLASLEALAKDCFDSLENDPRLFSTSIAVQDLEKVRESLGISQWNIYGVSYGTRVALHYLRRYPDAVRTLILDAVVPPELALGPDIGPLAQRALDLIFKRCFDESGCADAFSDMDKATLTLLNKLEAEPRTITYEDIASGKLATMEFTRNHLAITLRLMSYSSQTAAILPSMLHEAIVNDNFAPLARQADLQTRSVGESLATGMH
ncbi:MAG: alpha/beta fold hydrolase, partial [Granulosicoccus sp.]